MNADGSARKHDSSEINRVSSVSEGFVVETPWTCMAGETSSGSFDFPSVAEAPSGALRMTAVKGNEAQRFPRVMNNQLRNLLRRIRKGRYAVIPATGRLGNQGGEMLS